MGYNKRNTTLILIITIVSVLGLSIAFASFSSSLTVKGNATITPDSGNFKVVFSSKNDSLSTTGVSVTKTGNAQAGTPTIDNSTNPTIKNLSASFTSPGEKVEYTFYARNEGSYDAYLSSVVFDNIKGKSVFKECVVGEGTSSSMVESACNGIKVTTTVLSTSYTDTTLNITNHVLKKNNSEVVKVTIEYTSGSSVADGPFRIDFGNIYLTYGSTSLSGMPTLPQNNVSICTAVNTSIAGNIPMRQFLPGDEYVCQVNDTTSYNFYILNTIGDSVNLIMNRTICKDGTVDATSNCGPAWISKEDYIAAGGTENDYGEYGNNDKGPITALKFLNEATSGWTNIPFINETLTDENSKYNPIKLTGRSRLPKLSEIDTIINSSNSAWLVIGMPSMEDMPYADGTFEKNAYYWTSTTDSATSYVYQVGGMPGEKTASRVSMPPFLDESYSRGVRPVIKLNKAELN